MPKFDKTSPKIEDNHWAQCGSAVQSSLEANKCWKTRAAAQGIKNTT